MNTTLGVASFVAGVRGVRIVMYAGRESEHSMAGLPRQHRKGVRFGVRVWVSKL